jgi:type II secretory pathway component PulC
MAKKVKVFTLNDMNLMYNKANQTLITPNGSYSAGDFRKRWFKDNIESSFFKFDSKTHLLTGKVANHYFSVNGVIFNDKLEFVAVYCKSLSEYYCLDEYLVKKLHFPKSSLKKKHEKLLESVKGRINSVIEKVYCIDSSNLKPGDLDVCINNIDAKIKNLKLRCLKLPQLLR